MVFKFFILIFDSDVLSYVFICCTLLWVFRKVVYKINNQSVNFEVCKLLFLSYVY